MKWHRLRKVWLVAATIGLAACASQDTAPISTSTTVATTTVVEDSVGPTTSVAESVASTVGETSASKLRAEFGVNLDSSEHLVVVRYGFKGMPQR